jgi:hypothetical protein
MSFSQSLNGVGYASSAAADVVAVYDADFNQLFADARPLKVNVKEGQKLPENPVETGAVITDHRVIMPYTIDLAMVLTPQTFQNTYQEIRAIFNGVAPVQIQTMTDLYTNLFIQDLPHEENPEHFDTITMVLKFKQIIFVSPSTSALPNVGNQTGQKASPTTTEQATTTTQESSAAYSILFGNGEK